MLRDDYPVKSSGHGRAVLIYFHCYLKNESCRHISCHAVVESAADIVMLDGSP